MTPMLARRALLGVALATVVSGCSVKVRRSDPSAAPSAEQTRATLVRRMEESRDAWNRADMAGHVAMYAEDATMMSGTGPRGGRDVIRGMLERGFWQGGRPAARLDFSDLAVTPLGAEHAMMTGAFLLTYPDGRTTSGRYTLVWKRGADGEWLVIHDHSG